MKNSPESVFSDLAALLGDSVPNNRPTPTIDVSDADDGDELTAPADAPPELGQLRQCQRQPGRVGVLAHRSSPASW